MQSDLLMVAPSPAAEPTQMKTIDAAPNSAACFIIRPSPLVTYHCKHIRPMSPESSNNVSNRSEPVLNAPQDVSHLFALVGRQVLKL
jgi:hypothetical protein